MRKGLLNRGSRPQISEGQPRDVAEELPTVARAHAQRTAANLTLHDF